MKDADEISVSKKKEPSDLTGTFAAFTSSIQLKLLGILFFIYILLSSDVFITRILSRIENAVAINNSVTTTGVIITGILLVLFTAIADILIKQKII